MIPFNSVLDFHEIDKEQGVERIYKYYSKVSTHVNTEKQEVDILESDIWGKMLFLDGVLQSTTRDEVLYHNALVHPLMDTLREKKRILILGGGEGATAREVLRWKDVETVTMVEYDKELVDLMKVNGSMWSQGSFDDPRLTIVYDDAWNYMKDTSISYNGVIIDLTDPSLRTEDWKSLIESVLYSVKGIGRGGFVMNAGLYTPWNTGQLHTLKNMIEELCSIHPEFKYYMYTAIIPSFNGEWTFIVVSYKSRQMIDPDHLSIIPYWIRRSIRMLDPNLLDEPITTDPIGSQITSHV